MNEKDFPREVECAIDPKDLDCIKKRILEVNKYLIFYYLHTRGTCHPSIREFAAANSTQMNFLAWALHFVGNSCIKNPNLHLEMANLACNSIIESMYAFSSSSGTVYRSLYEYKKIIDSVTQTLSCPCQRS